MHSGFILGCIGFLTGMKTLVVGIGNPLRRDDGLGWLLADAIRMKNPANVEVRHELQLLPELAAEVSRFDRVFLLDAAVGLEPDDFRRFDLVVDPVSSHRVHDFPVRDLLDLMKILNPDWTPQLYLLAVAGQDFSVGEGLSETCSGMLPVWQEKALQEILH